MGLLDRKEGTYIMNLTDEKLAVVKKLPEVKNISLIEEGKGQMFGGHKEWDITISDPFFPLKKGGCV